VDLVIYVSLAVLGCLWLDLVARQHRLEGSLTEIARALALRDTTQPDDTAPGVADRQPPRGP
jgi:hypothetical protein